MDTGALETLVRSAAVPLAAVELPSGQVLAVNEPLAAALDATVDALTGAFALDRLSPADREAGELGYRALADGSLTGYQAIRRIGYAGKPDRVASVWTSVIDFEGVRVGLTSVIPSTRPGQPSGGPPPLPPLPGPGDAVLGTVDGSWRVDRISQDVAAVLGVTPGQCVGQPVLGAIHPSDVPVFLAAVEHSRRGERAVQVPLRLSPGAREDWHEVAAVIATISPGDPPALAFALMPAGPGAGPGPGAVAGPGSGADVAAGVGSARELRLEAHLRRIAEELHAAGVVPRLRRLPALADMPRLGELTSREWGVLSRLLGGERVPGIAAALFVSQSTVRNHLSSIYAKLGVSGQLDLVRLIHPGTTPPGEDRSPPSGR